VSSRRRRSFSRDFKLAALRRMAEAPSIVALAEELGLQRKMLYAWREAYAAGGEAGLRRCGRPRKQEQAAAGLPDPDGAPQRLDPAQRIADLERLVGQQQRDLDFFRAALRHVRAQRRKSGGSGGGASTP
jgi:transposase-like protein